MNDEQPTLKEIVNGRNHGLLRLKGGVVAVIEGEDGFYLLQDDNRFLNNEDIHRYNEGVGMNPLDLAMLVAASVRKQTALDGK